MTVSGEVTDVVIDPESLGQWAVPGSLDRGAGGRVSGNLFGGTVSATLIAGVVRYDSLGDSSMGSAISIGTTTHDPDPDTNYSSAP